LGLSVIGKAGEITLNSGSDTATPEIMTKAVVLFVRVSVMVLLLPTTTVPKLRFVLPSERAPFGLELPPKSPWQPVIVTMEKIRRVTAIRSQRELRSMGAPLSAALAFVRRESFNFRYCQRALIGELQTNNGGIAESFWRRRLGITRYQKGKVDMIEGSTCGSFR